MKDEILDNVNKIEDQKTLEKIIDENPHAFDRVNCISPTEVKSIFDLNKRRAGRYPWGSKEMEEDAMVNHPTHYQSETGLEAIDVIEAFTFDLCGVEAVCTGNALKYLCRWKKKDGLKDLKKARWYLNHLIEHVENLQKENEQQ